MGRTIHLTSPLTTGSDVKAFQTVLIKKGYLKGKVDGAYGPATARAVYRAKYWLGYLKPDQFAGDRLYGYLTGVKRPTLAMKALAYKRRQATKKVSVGVKMLSIAKTFIGTKESPPGTNKVLFSDWYGITGPWCAMFMTYCGVKAGSKAFVKGQRYAYVPYVLNDARAGKNNLSVTDLPKPGDLVLFDWNGDGLADHIGILDHVVDQERIVTVEGNTSVGNDSNGGEVMLRQDRTKSEVIAFVHVGA